jgi:malate permease and related proteins
MIQGQQAAWRTLLTSPVIYAALLGFALLQMQVSMPLPLSNTIELISGVTLPMMLIAMGYSLATFSFSRFGFAFGLTALRFMLGLSAGFFVVWWLELEGTLRGVVIIEASMPVAIFNYLFAARYDRDPEDIASAILISTLISLLTLPWLLLFALGEL